MAEWDWLEWVIIPALFIGIVGAYFGLLVGVCLWEKYMVWPYATPDNLGATDPAGAGYRPQPPIPLSHEAGVANAMARSLGFTSLGVFADARGGMYQTCFFFWRSAERDVLGVVGNGTIAKIPLQSIVLYTLLTDDTCLISINNPQSSQTDLAGISDEAQNLGASFNELLKWHRDRIALARANVRPFSERDPLADLRQFRARRTDLIEDLGLARYLDPSRNAFRYTLRGALTYVARLATKMVRRKYWPDARR